MGSDTSTGTDVPRTTSVPESVSRTFSNNDIGVTYGHKLPVASADSGLGTRTLGFVKRGMGFPDRNLEIVSRGGAFDIRIAGMSISETSKADSSDASYEVSIDLRRSGLQGDIGQRFVDAGYANVSNVEDFAQGRLKFSIPKSKFESRFATQDSGKPVEREVLGSIATEAASHVLKAYDSVVWKEAYESRISDMVNAGYFLHGGDDPTSWNLIDERKINSTQGRGRDQVRFSKKYQSGRNLDDEEMSRARGGGDNGGNRSDAQPPNIADVYARAGEAARARQAQETNAAYETFGFKPGGTKAEFDKAFKAQIREAMDQGGTPDEIQERVNKIAYAKAEVYKKEEFSNATADVSDFAPGSRSAVRSDSTRTSANDPTDGGSSYNSSSAGNSFADSSAPDSSLTGSSSNDGPSSADSRSSSGSRSGSGTDSASVPKETASAAGTSATSADIAG